MLFQGNPRLTVALETVLRGLLRILLGTNAQVTVRAGSNRAVLSGKLSVLAVDAGAMAGLLLSARGGSLRGTQLDFGVRPLLVFLYIPTVLFGLVDFLSMTVLTVCAYCLVPPASPSTSLQYSLSLAEEDMNSSFAVRWILKVALSSLMRNSILISALRSRILLHLYIHTFIHSCIFASNIHACMPPAMPSCKHSHAELVQVDDFRGFS